MLLNASLMVLAAASALDSLTVKVARDPSSTYMAVTASVGRSSSPTSCPSSKIVPMPVARVMVALTELARTRLKVSDPS